MTELEPCRHDWERVGHIEFGPLDLSDDAPNTDTLVHDGYQCTQCDLTATHLVPAEESKIYDTMEALFEDAERELAEARR